jgi:NDP-sugar pyrophosphorylase family protein
MILAAGLGTRMAPLTPSIPKPALPVLDEPLVLALVRTLARAGVEACIVNTHGNAQVLEQSVAGAPIPVHFSPEPALRGSGGGIGGARSFLLRQGRPFLVLNGDMSLELDLGALVESHRQARSNGALATLVLRDEARKQQFGSLGYDERGLVRRITKHVDRGGEVASGLFAGVQLMEPALLDHFPERVSFDIVRDVYVPLLEQGEGALAAWPMPVSQRWEPVGTPRELLDVNLRALVARHPSGYLAPSACVEGHVQMPVFVGEGARVRKGARLGPRVVVGARAEVGPGARICDTLLLPGARPPEVALSRTICFETEVWSDA